MILKATNVPLKFSVFIEASVDYHTPNHPNFLCYWIVRWFFVRFGWVTCLLLLMMTLYMVLVELKRTSIALFLSKKKVTGSRTRQRNWTRRSKALSQNLWLCQVDQWILILLRRIMMMHHIAHLNQIFFIVK